MEVSLSLDADLSEDQSFGAGEVCLSEFLAETDYETRSFLHHSTLMDRFRSYVDERAFVDVKLVGSDFQVSRKTDQTLCARLYQIDYSPQIIGATRITFKGK